MNKFKQINYIRPNVNELENEYKSLQDQLKKADSYEKVRAVFLRQQEITRDVSTSFELVSIRNTINTADEYYEAEMKFFNEEMPKMLLLNKKLSKSILQSPFKDKLEEEFGAMFIKKIEASQKTMKTKILLDMVKENKLCTEYSKTAASCTTMFRGEKCNFYGLLKHMQSLDREERKEAFEAWAKLYEDNSSKLDEEFTKLVNTRVKMAKKLDLNNYIELAYLNRERFDYDAKDVEVFRNNIKKYVVPVCQKIVEEQAKRLGIDKLKYYDESLMYKDGNAVPIGDKDSMVNTAQKMYRELSAETGEFFDFMVRYELFDLETKPNKHLGGYCTQLSKYQAPFIFSNFNGTSADVDVLTHEAGHAFEAFVATRLQKVNEYYFSTSEINEIHSMAMEYFTYPWMKDFFGENVDKYYYAHTADSLLVIPYMACVDEFQHRVYENPKMNAHQRRQVWSQLEKDYLPWRDYDGNKFLEEGGFWMQKQHIFLYPFYYIDYALAQICVFELFGRMKKNKAEAWQDYLNLCKAGGSKSYFELLKIANLSSPFEEETIKNAVQIIADELNIK